MGKTSEKKAARREAWVARKKNSDQRKVMADAVEEDVRRAAEALGIRLVVTHPQPISRKGKPTATTRHWMFNDETTGLRLLDYWPSTGRFIDFNKVGGTAGDPWEALEQARRWVTPVNPL